MMTLKTSVFIKKTQIFLIVVFQELPYMENIVYEYCCLIYTLEIISYL